MNFPFLFTFREEQKKLSLEIHRKLPLISLPPVKSPPLTYTPPLPSLISHPPPLLVIGPLARKQKNISVRKPSSSFSFLVLRQELSTTPVILTENLKFLQNNNFINIFKLSNLFVLTKPLIMFQSVEINSIYTDVFEVN